MATAISTGGAIDFSLYFGSQDLKRLIGVVPGREVAAKGEVLFFFRGSEPKYFSQVGNHAYQYSCTVPAS